MDSNRRNINRKREDYIDWHDYFMATAFLAAKRSKDPCSQVGACIVNEDKKVVGVGYNGMPTGCSDDVFPWAKESKNPQDNKYYYVCHAEVNAVLNKNCADVKNCTIYVGLFPCNECAKVIIQSGIKEVIYLSDKHSHKASTMASKRMLDAANVKYWKYVPQSSKIVIDFNEINWNDMNQLRQTPKKSNDNVDDDLIEPISDMTLNDSVMDNHSKSLDYISGSTEKFYYLCNGKVVDAAESLKCNSIVHLSAREKLTPYQHQTSKVENDRNPSKLSIDLSADYHALKATNEQYQNIIQEIKGKTELLIENNRLLLENNQLLKEKIFALETKKN